MNKPNFSDETKQEIFDALNGYCCVGNCYNRIMDFHHKLHNFKHYQLKFPLFLQSVFNCAGTCRDCHNDYSIHPELNITENVAEVFENYLNELLEN